jgi:hypothetical protein
MSFSSNLLLLGVQRPKRREAKCAREAWSNMILHVPSVFYMHNRAF